MISKDKRPHEVTHFSIIKCSKSKKSKNPCSHIYTKTKKNMFFFNPSAKIYQKNQIQRGEKRENKTEGEMFSFIIK